MFVDGGSNAPNARSQVLLKPNLQAEVNKGHRRQIMTANGNPRVVFFAVAFLASLGAVLGPSPAYGQACGDVIRTDTVLTCGHRAMSWRRTPY
jgi:hypothetical protein